MKERCMTPPAPWGGFMSQSHPEQPKEEGKRLWCYEKHVGSHFSRSISETFSKNTHTWNGKRRDVVCPARTAPTGISSLVYHQSSPGNMTQFWLAFVWGIDTMMSPWQQVEIKTNMDNSSGGSCDHKCSNTIQARCSPKCRRETLLLNGRSVFLRPYVDNSIALCCLIRRINRSSCLPESPPSFIIASSLWCTSTQIIFELQFIEHLFHSSVESVSSWRTTQHRILQMTPASSHVRVCLPKPYLWPL